jgi:hypothetical protein
LLGGRYKLAAQDPEVRLAQLPVDVTRSVQRTRLAAARAAKDAAEAESGSLTSEETSNGKSSIVEEQRFSSLFFQKKTKLRFFRFSSFTQLGTKTFVLLRSCKIF